MAKNKEWFDAYQAFKDSVRSYNYTSRIEASINRALRKKEKTAVYRFMNTGYPCDYDYLKLLESILIDRVMFDSYDKPFLPVSSRSKKEISNNLEHPDKFI